jgi:hypothetical protein
MTKLAAEYAEIPKREGPETQSSSNYELDPKKSS